MIKGKLSVISYILLPLKLWDLEICSSGLVWWKWWENCKQKHKLHKVPYISSTNHLAIKLLLFVVSCRFKGEMQNSWLSRKAEEIENFADPGKTKEVFEVVKIIYGSQPVGILLLLSFSVSVSTHNGEVTNFAMLGWVFQNILNGIF